VIITIYFVVQQLMTAS